MFVSCKALRAVSSSSANKITFNVMVGSISDLLHRPPTVPRARTPVPQTITAMSYYHGLISSKKASTLLENEGDGYFIIRDSQSQPGCFVISAK